MRPCDGPKSHDKLATALRAMGTSEFLDHAKLLEELKMTPFQPQTEEAGNILIATPSAKISTRR